MSSRCVAKVSMLLRSDTMKVSCVLVRSSVPGFAVTDQALIALAKSVLARVSGMS